VFAIIPVISLGQIVQLRRGALNDALYHSPQLAQLRANLIKVTFVLFLGRRKEPSSHATS
jgi:hypothetical protein